MVSAPIPERSDDHDHGVDALVGALQRAQNAEGARREELITRAVQVAYRTRQLHRLAGHELMVSELGTPVLDLIDVSRALLAGDIDGAMAVLGIAARSVDTPLWAVAASSVASDVLIATTRLGSWRAAAQVMSLTVSLLRKAGASAGEGAPTDRELAAIITGVRFDTLAAAALIEHHTSVAGAPTTAFDSLTTALDVPRTRHLLGHEHGYALLAQGSILNGRRELGRAAVALSRAVQLLSSTRHQLVQDARAELALVRIRQARWDDARKLAAELDLGAADPGDHAVALATRSVLAALVGHFAEADRVLDQAALATGRHSAIITSTLVSHARIASAIGRNAWGRLSRDLDDLQQLDHRSIFDQHEWFALRSLALWHTGHIAQYRELYARWAAVPGAEQHAYRWAHAAIIARIDLDDAAALTFTNRAIEAIDDDYDPLGRTWVRIVAGTHLSLLGDPVNGLTQYEDARDELLALGADGFAALCTTIIRSTIEQLAESQNDPVAALTAQQREIARLIAAGYTSTEIGELLHLSRKTIDFHASNIVNRLGVRNRREIGRVIEALPG